MQTKCSAVRINVEVASHPHYIAPHIILTVLLYSSHANQGVVFQVSCIAFTANSSLLASGQTGQMSAVRVWKYASGECLSIGKVHDHSLSSLR